MKIATMLTTLMAALLFGGSARAGTETVLHNFSVGSDGYLPADIGHLARDASGNLFGTTQGGGSCGRGIVFELSKSSDIWTEQILYNFCQSDGDNPSADVILDSQGVIYGTTEFGGSGNCGTVYRLTGSTLVTLYNFTCALDGGIPSSGVILDGAGNLFGTATLHGRFGNSNGGGVVYEISNAGTFSVLHTFCSRAHCTDGNSPYGGLAMDNEGTIYGTTTYGGDATCNCGVVFKLSNATGVWVETVLHTFLGGSNDGAGPTFASLTLATPRIRGTKRSAIVGVTTAGGSQDLGTVFRLLNRDNGYDFGLLSSFTGSDGSFPLGTLLAMKGGFVGTSYSGGRGFGTVFQLVPLNGVWTQTAIYTFTGGSDGGNPNSGIVADTEGNLYGVTPNGGFGVGVVYQVVPRSSL